MKLTQRKRVRRTGSDGPFNGMVMEVVPENNSVRVAWWDDAKMTYVEPGEWLSTEQVEPIAYGKNVKTDGYL